MAELRRQIEYTTGWAGSTVHLADRWYPSSKTCSGCGGENQTAPCPNGPTAASSAPWCWTAIGAPPATSPDSSSRSAVARPPRVAWATVNEPDGNPHRVGSGYRHGKTHEVNAAPQGDDCPNRVDPRLLTLQVTVPARKRREAGGERPGRPTPPVR
jgi:hypothetical protein